MNAALIMQGNSKMNAAFIRDIIQIDDNCTSCGHCLSSCHAGAIIEIDNKYCIDSQRCTNCGQCITSCSIKAINDFSMVPQIRKALANPKKTVVVQVDPFIRLDLGKQLGLNPEINIRSKIYTALHFLGFDKVYDTEFTADLTIIEEATGLIHRLYKAFGVKGFADAGPLPQFTSSCPAWAKYAEDNYDQIMPYLSAAKSPQQMFGSVSKSYTADKLNINCADIFVVSVAPCTAKKYECQRADRIAGGVNEVDAVITTRELVQMINDANLDLLSLPDGSTDRLIGSSSGAAALFAETGGTMVAALKTAYELISDQAFPNISFKTVNGLSQVIEATINFPIKPLDRYLPINVCVVNGMEHVDPILDDVLNGCSKYHFVEVLGCPGGCINGGGQPALK